MNALAAQGVRLIGLHGVKRSGKDTTASFIQEWAYERGLAHRRQGWADAMKISIARLFGVEDERAIRFCDLVKEFGTVRVSVDAPGMGDIGTVHPIVVQGRDFLKRYGTESHRDMFGQDFWLDQLLPRGGGDKGENIRWWQEWDQPQIAIVTDCRFVNEINRIHDLGGEVWLIDRDTGDDDDHVSEQTHRSLCDLEIDNNHSLEHLRTEVRAILSSS